MLNRAQLHIFVPHVSIWAILDDSSVAQIVHQIQSICTITLQEAGCSEDELRVKDSAIAST